MADHSRLFDYDAELRPHNEIFRAAARVGPRDRVLDIGCGAGQTTREAARAAVEGTAVGVDRSAQMLERARRLSRDQGLSNVTYEQADAQVHRFPPARFDVCISRFGTMFFADPVAAFTNIGLALRPAARLVLLVWQGRDRNAWDSVISQPRDPGSDSPAPGPGPFSLADPAFTEEVLTAAGFTDAGFTEVDEPVYYGPDSAAAFDNVTRLWDENRLAGLDAATVERARTRLRAALDAHSTDSGVYFDSRAWIVEARRHS
ncbi:class I SAM-dependent methyltransferase [Actinomadura citrea]|uniref:SAM-dependent methyltransferase n=1 Tax=Actinomadura citrea TaxID=46158 RepID=A0A7Y9KI35_9ACTN|nr:class I SAM-dependent methyltransferase [Actinomadura citrea]NYE16389.1 SAM-dependent methyltransferase [Actinomadura citrea]GGT95354.1 methyltransferase [Actinomadura citrea]